MIDIAGLIIHFLVCINYCNFIWGGRKEKVYSHCVLKSDLLLEIKALVDEVFLHLTQFQQNPAFILQILILVKHFFLTVLNIKK